MPDGGALRTVEAMSDDPRLAAARYLAEQAMQTDAAASDQAAPVTPAGAAGPGARRRAETVGPTPQQRAAIVENAIQQAMRRGDFDNLPGAGKPLPGLGGTYDPDWWVRRKIETEQLQGLGPPALTLRVEDAELDARLDALFREAEVRAALVEFNRRVVEARRQLLGGPPVVTPLRDVEAEVAAWHDRRMHRQQVQAARDDGAGRRHRWWNRRAR